LTSKAIEFGEIAQSKGYYAVQGHRRDVGTNRKHVCDFLLVINTDILSRTVSKLSQIIVAMLDTVCFEPHGGVVGNALLFILGSLESA